VRPLKIALVSPGRAGVPTGNEVTVRRWAAQLRSLGHQVTVGREWRGAGCDVMVALHARKSHGSIARFRRTFPKAPLLVALTGTDLYGDIRTSARARRSLALATRIVVLQPEGLRELPQIVRPKTRVLEQSAERPPGRFTRRRDVFEVCLLSHVRPVKDPLRAPLAARRLPASSRLRLVHLGAALDVRLAARLSREQETNRRYRWLGPVPRGRALRTLGRCRLLAVTSLLEGGGNAVVEALACGVPVVSSRISGIIGTLGRGYPGYFTVGDTAALARLLQRAETDRSFYARLAAWCRQRARRVSPARERTAWQRLLRELRPALQDAARNKAAVPLVSPLRRRSHGRHSSG